MTNNTTQIEELKTSILNAVDSNEAKIQFIKQELDAGRYEINAEQIAEKMLEPVKTNESSKVLETA